MQSSDVQRFDYEHTVMSIGDTYPRFEYRAAHLFPLLPKDKKVTLLDFGCGAGWYLRFIQSRFSQVELYGCDISKAAIAYAKTVSQGIHYYDYEGQRLPFADNTFDFCICLDVLEHVENYEQILDELHRVLKPGGYLYTNIPCEGNMFTLPWFFQKIRLGSKLTFRYFGHIHPEFTTSYVRNKVAAHGFTIVRERMSEFFLTHFLRLIFYFIPKELLRLVLGAQADEYSDVGIIRHKDDHSLKRKMMLAVRFIWRELGRLSGMGMISYLETVILGRIHFGAVTVHLTCKKQ